VKDTNNVMEQILQKEKPVMNIVISSDHQPWYDVSMSAILISLSRNERYFHSDGHLMIQIISSLGISVMANLMEKFLKTVLCVPLIFIMEIIKNQIIILCIHLLNHVKKIIEMHSLYLRIYKQSELIDGHCSMHSENML